MCRSLREQAHSHKDLRRVCVSSPNSIPHLIKVIRHVFLTDLHSFWSLPMPLVRVDIQKHRSSPKSLLLLTNPPESRPCFGRAPPVGYSDASWPGGK